MSHHPDPAEAIDLPQHLLDLLASLPTNSDREDRKTDHGKLLPDHSSDSGRMAAVVAIPEWKSHRADKRGARIRLSEIPRGTTSQAPHACTAR
jgi:hypothetical protein